ncbi:solute carrier family 43 member 3 [Aplysia californica]|uniref:Solute carrier family 43 member 3 n=1 Tax=Aplysia californica TaxID=6500 RepID=A0ABM1A8A0_APLCA|nr:solute carrier family 43 member 3 [Aplysia californica]
MDRPYKYERVMGNRLQQSKGFKIFITIWCFFENILFAGLRAGWPALVYVLKQEGIYQDLCMPPTAVSGGGENVLLHNKTNSAQTNAKIQASVSAKRGQYETSTVGSNNTLISTVLYSVFNQSALGHSEGFPPRSVDDAIVEIVTPMTQHMPSFGQEMLSVNQTADYNSTWLNPNVNSTLIGCMEQDAVFNQCFTVASATMSLSALMYGQLNYKFGIRAPRVLSVFIFVMGALCIAFLDQDTPWLVFPGLLLLSSGGMALYLTNNQVSYMFSSGGAAVVGLLCGALEASSFVMTLVKIAYEQGVSLQLSFLVLGGLYVSTMVSTFFFLPRHFISNSKDDSKTTVEKNEDVHDYDKPSTLPDNIYVIDNNSLPDKSADDMVVVEDGAHAVVIHPEKNSEQVGVYPSLQLEKSVDGLAIGVNGSSKSIEVNGVTKDTEKERSDKMTSRKGIGKNGASGKGRSLLQCFLSRTFLLYLFWAAVVQVILAMCLGTFNPWLVYVTNHNVNEVSAYTDALLYSMLASPVLALVTGLAMDCLQKSKVKEVHAVRIRTIFTATISLSTTSVLGVLVCACVMALNPDLIILTCIALVIFRTALYSCGTAFLRIMYPTEYFGILCGVMTVLAGGFSFIQYPMFLWVQSRGEAWREVFGFLGLLGVVSLAHPLYLYWKGRRLAKSNFVASPN